MLVAVGSITELILRLDTLMTRTTCQAKNLNDIVAINIALIMVPVLLKSPILASARASDDCGVLISNNLWVNV